MQQHENLRYEEFCENTHSVTVAVCCVDMMWCIDNSRRPNRRTIMNLFHKQKLEIYMIQQYFTPPNLSLKHH